MADQRALQALGRIERALARVDAAAEKLGERGPAGVSEEIDRLREAHDALRGKVEGAIGEIDQLLVEGGRG